MLHVDDGRDSVTFLNFCKDAKACPFTVFVLPDDLRKVGDIRQLEGRKIEIKGTIEDHDKRAGITLRRTQQLGESAYVVVPAVPTEYDVEPTAMAKPKASVPSIMETGRLCPMMSLTRWLRYL